MLKKSSVILCGSFLYGMRPCCQTYLNCVDREHRVEDVRALVLVEMIKEDVSRDGL